MLKTEEDEKMFHKQWKIILKKLMKKVLKCIFQHRGADGAAPAAGGIALVLCTLGFIRSLWEYVGGSFEFRV